MIRQAAGACLVRRRWVEPGRLGRAVFNVALRRSVTAMAMTVAVAMVATTVAAAAIIALVMAVVAAIVTPFFPKVAAVATAVAVVAWFAVAAVFLAVARGIFTAVPVVLDEIDALAAGMVTMTVLFPMSGVARRDAQIERRTTHRHGLDHHRLGKEQRGRGEAADVEAAIKAGLADTDRDLGGGRSAQGDGADGEAEG